MRRATLMLAGLLLVALLGTFRTAPTTAAPRQQSGVATDDFTVTLGDGWQSKAKLTYPSGNTGKLPTLILTYPGDMDFTIGPNDGFGAGGLYFKDLAEALSAQGVAVVRYNSRYVSDISDAYNDKAVALALSDHTADAERVLAAVRGLPRVDPARVFVYGWSYSSPLAANVAARDPALGGVILQGTMASSDKQLFIDDYAQGGIPYALSFSTDGTITGDVLERARDGNGTFAKFAALDFIDPAVTDTVKVNPLLDTNADGVLDPEGEIKPNLGALVDADPSGQVAMFRTLPSVREVAPQIAVPVLMVQGEEDTATRAPDVRALAPAFAGNRDFTQKFYPGLGHALAPKPSRFEDHLIPMVAQPKADIAAWIKAHAGAGPVALPNTGGETPAGALLGLALLACIAGALLVRRGTISRR